MIVVEREPETRRRGAQPYIGSLQENLSTVPSYVAINAAGHVMGIGDDLIRLIRNYSEPAPRGQLAAYSEVIRSLETLRNVPESDDLGRVRPSQHAIVTASKVAFRMAGSSAEMPLPEDISADRDGAVRILWERDDRTLELVCPFEAGERAYMYYSDASQYRIAHDLSSQRLARLLCWLKAKSNEFPK